MTGAQAECYGDIQIAEDAGDRLLKRVARLCGRRTLEHLSEDDAPNLLQLACILQVHQHAIDSVGPLAEVFDKQDRVFGLKLIRCSNRGDK